MNPRIEFAAAFDAIEADDSLTPMQRHRAITRLEIMAEMGMYITPEGKGIARSTATRI